MLEKRIIFLILPILFLSGCVSIPSSTITPSVSIPSTVPLSVTSSPTFQVQPTFIVTSRPVQTLSSTQVLTITQTPTVASTPKPSLTFLPTFPNPREAAIQLYGTNGGCKLPCWWGITPGKTSLEQVHQYFQQFTGEVLVSENENHSVAVIYYPPANDSVDYTIATQLYISNNIVGAITLDYEAAMWGGFSPDRMLTEYGKPEQIFFRSVNETTGYLAFLYSNKHIFVEYLFSIKEKRACFNAFGSITTWSTDMSMIQEISQGSYPLNPIEESTIMNTESLSEIIKEQSTKTCFLVR